MDQRLNCSGRAVRLNDGFPAMVKRLHKIRSNEQLEALVLPLRGEIMDTVGALGPLSVAEIAESLGKRRPAVHYQVNYLVELGLLFPAGTRGEGRKQEALFRTEGRLIAVVFDKDDPKNVELTVACVKRALGRAQRLLAKAFTWPGVRTRGPKRNTHSSQLTCRLDPDQLAEVNECLDRLRALCSPATLREEGELHLLTIALSPLEPQGPGTGKQKGRT